MVRWPARKRFTRYLIQTKHFCLVYREENSYIVLIVYTDAYWARDEETRRSMRGCVVMMGGAAIKWYCRQQEVVALFSTELEYILFCSATKETVWIRRSLNVLVGSPKDLIPTLIYVGNQGGIQLCFY